MMEKFFAFRDKCLTSDIHPILTACRLLIALLHIHPFYDGNCRVSRVTMASHLIRHGYPPMLFLDPDRIEFALSRELLVYSRLWAPLRLRYHEYKGHSDFEDGADGLMPQIFCWRKSGDRWVEGVDAGEVGFGLGK